MKLLGITKNKINKDENGENVPHLEIAEAVSVHCNIISNNYQQDSRVLYIYMLLISHLVNYQMFNSEILFFLNLLIQKFNILKYDLMIKILKHYRQEIE